MADEDNGAAKETPKDKTAAQSGNGADTQKQAAQPKMQILTQFVRDLSFENVLAQKGIGGEVQPDVTVNVNMDAKKRAAENQYEVVIKSTIQSKNKGTGDSLFMLELEYAGVFQVENVPEDQLHPFLMIECPRMLFPFFRRIVSDVTRDGGFPPLNLENIDFVGIYRQEIMRRQAEMAKDDQPIV